MKLKLISRIAAAALALQLMATAAHATLVSAPFSEGFIGRYTNNAHQPTGIKTFNTLGIARAYLQQNTSNGQFGGVQGNDLTANLKLVFTNGTVINVPGAINWRDGANPLNGVGFIPDNTYTGSFSYGAGLTYDMNGLSVAVADNKFSSFLVQLNTSAITYVDNTSVGGNAALNATAWTALNNYLATTVSSRPAGPVAVVSQSTTDTTPTVTGTVTIQATEDLTVEINGVTYTTANGLVLDRNAGTWSITIPGGSALSPTVYDVTATIVNQSGYVLADSTSGELTIQALTPAITLTKTASVSGNVVTYSYSVANTGAYDLDTVTISETAGKFTGSGTLPSPVIDATATGTADDDAILNVGETWYYTADYTLTQADLDAGSVTNGASVSSLDPSDNVVSDASDDGNAADGPDAGTAGDDDPTVTALTQTPELTLVKTATASGSDVTYTYVVTNTGNVTLTTVSVSESALGFSGTGTRPTPVIDAAATGTADDDSELDVGESWTFSATYTLTQADLDTGSVSNSATASAKDPSNATVTDTSDSGDEATDTAADGDSDPTNDPTVTTLPQNPEMTLVKSASVSGVTVTYTYALTNTGNVTLDTVSVTEPDDVTHPFTGTESAPVPAAVLSGGHNSGDTDADGLFDVGETWNYTATYTMSDADVLAGGVSNSAYASASDPNDNSVEDTSDNGDEAVDDDGDTDPTNDPTDAVIIPNGEMTLHKSASLSGATLTYNYYVENTGNLSITNPVIGESAGDFTGNYANLSAVTPVRAGVMNSGDTDQDDVLDIGETWVFTATYTLDSNDYTLGSVTNSATVTGKDPDLNDVTDTSDDGNEAADGPDADADPTNDPTETSTVAAPALTLVKTASVSGSTVTYTYVVTNTGNVDLDTVSVAEPDDANNPFSGTGTAPTPTIDAAATGTADDDGILNAGEEWTFTATYTLTTQDFDAGSVSNSALATAQTQDDTPVFDVSDDDNGATDGPDAGSDPDDDPTETSLTQNPELALVKTGSVSGEDLTYTYSVTNTGNVSLTNVSVDESAGDFTGTFANLTTPAYQSGDSDSDNVLDTGETWIFAATYTVGTDDWNAGEVSNSATATADDPSSSPVTDTSDDGNPADGPDVGSDTDDDPTVTTLSATGALSITHELTDMTRQFPGLYQVTYQVTLENTGPITQNNVSLINDLIAFLGAGNLEGAPSVTIVSGSCSANVDFDGNSDTEVLATGCTLDPSDTLVLTITFDADTSGGFPSGSNDADGNADELSAPVTDGEGLGVVDTDDDGGPDGDESDATDRDGDGIMDADDYDPTGYFYCQDDGRILTGGSITVTGPSGSNSTVGTANGITIVHDGSSGFYQWFVSVAGQYEMTVTYPGGGTASTTRLAEAGVLDVTSLLPDDPAFLGSTEVGSTGFLADDTAGANPFYLLFDIEAGDPNVMANNIPLEDCASAGGLDITDDDLTASEDDDDSGQMSFALQTPPTGNVTLTFSGDSQCDVSPATMTFTPANWNVAQALTITGRGDAEEEGSHTCRPSVRTSSSDPDYDGLTPTLSAVALDDGLVTAVADRVREKLVEDLRETLSARQATMRNITKGAEARLAENPDDIECRAEGDGQPHGSISASNGEIAINGTIVDQGNPCVLQDRRIVQSEFKLIHSADGRSTIDVAFDMLREDRISEYRIRGRFFGGYLRFPMGEGDRVRGMGLHLGIYGADKHENGSITSHYLALGIGRHDYKFTFGNVSPITATGDYSYIAGYGGVAWSRDRQIGNLIVTPRAGLDLAIGIPTSASILAKQGGVTGSGSVDFPVVGVLRASFEAGISPVDKPEQIGVAISDWRLTPGLFCDFYFGGGADQRCGFSLDFGFNHKSADRLTEFEAEIETEITQNSDSIGLSLRHIRYFDGVNGQDQTGLTLQSDGDIRLEKQVEIRF